MITGRTVILDWAVSQTKYLEATKVKEEHVKKEPDDIKEEKFDDYVKSEFADKEVGEHVLQDTDHVKSEDSEFEDDM